jgi:hypothetical protein
LGDIAYTKNQFLAAGGLQSFAPEKKIGALGA